MIHLRHSQVIPDGERWASQPTIVTPDEQSSEPEESKPPGPSLANSRGLWLSDDQDDTSILDRYLKVQQYKDIKMTSIDSEC